MWQLNVCTVCLSTKGNLYNIDSCNLRINYNSVSGLETHKGNGLPEFLCVECKAYIQRCSSFRDKCQRAYFALQDVLQEEKQITPAHIEAIDRKAVNIMPSLTFADHRKFKFETAVFKSLKQSCPRDQRTGNLTEHIERQCRKEHKICENLNIKTKTKSTKEKSQIIKIESDDDSIMNLEAVDESAKEEPNSTLNFEADDCISDDFIQIQEDNNISVETNIGTNGGVEASTTEEEEYASMVPISMTDAKAAIEVLNMFTIGKFRCKECNKGFALEKTLETHARMHDKHFNGNFQCKLCNFYYRTDLMLKTHVIEKHVYKYICKQCPEVSFERTTAKQHYIKSHLQSGAKKSFDWCESKPAWVGGARGKMRSKSDKPSRPKPQGRRPKEHLPKDLIQVSLISPLDQYRLVKDRQNTTNYKTSPYQCEFCYRGFREVKTYSRHMQKHDEVSGALQCDMCKLRFPSTKEMYLHMKNTHLHRYACLKCKFVCYNRHQAIGHHRWHKNFEYKCGLCDKVFKKASTRGTHIRVKHPTTELCNICGNSFISNAGLVNHLKKSHSPEEINQAKALSVDKAHHLYCDECQVQFVSDAAFTTHLGSSSKHSTINVPVYGRRKEGRKSRNSKSHTNDSVHNIGLPIGHDCELCGVPLANDSKARQHYLSEHPGQAFLKRYMCDVCGHTTKNYANLVVHLRTHTREKPFACPHCDRRFSMTSSRDRHIVVHTGERRFECQHCLRRFTQSNTLKLHIQTVHLKIPYAPWDKKNRKRRKEMDGPQSELRLMMDSIN